jgi:hypothetical protein
MKPSAPTGRAGAAAALTEPADMHLAVVDGFGRVALAQAARSLGWSPGTRINVTARGAALHLSDIATTTRLTVPLDARSRLLIPYGLRTICGYQSGTRLVLVVICQERMIATWPLRNLLRALFEATT